MSSRRSLHPVGSLALCAALGLVSCWAPVPDLDRRDRNGQVDSVRVTITEGERGTLETPLPYAATNVTYTVRLEALDRGGQPATAFNGYLTVSVTPGALLNIEGPGSQGRSIQLTEGVAEGVRLTFARAYGETRIWAEESGYVPIDPNSEPRPACADGMDNDADGRSDFPADYGCAAPNDNDESNGSWAIGSSEPIYFASPTIADVQGQADTSPLLNERIVVTRGDLVVTRISTSGFWVTDVADRSCGGQPCYNSIFSFNFRLPEGMRPCDTLEQLQGSVQEFVSTTQFAQPAWRIGQLWISTEASGRCRIPDPVIITPTILMNADSQLEPLESSLVRIENAEISPNIGPERPTCNGVGVCNFAPGRSNCDVNGDNRIDFDNQMEATCANACQTTRGCSEWTNWLRFSQLAVDLPMQSSSATRIIISPRDAIPNWDPLRPPATMALAVTGTLKQVGPNWIIEPRCTQDLVLPNQTVLPAQEACLLPRTVTEEP